MARHRLRSACTRARPAARSSSSPSGCSTYTAARDSRALLTSKDGFSVVAPMNVNRPDSTYGRNASCWLLLKRWISSTNRIVRRARGVARRAARSIASRMSFTPASTADSAMNSASKASRHQPRQRGLADTGRSPQDHRMRLAGLESQPQRLARAEQVRLADDVVERGGRRRSASGAGAGWRSAIGRPARRRDCYCWITSAPAAA